MVDEGSLSNSPSIDTPQDRAAVDGWIAAKDVPKHMEGMTAWIWREWDGQFNPRVEQIPSGYSRRPASCQGIWFMPIPTPFAPIANAIAEAPDSAEGVNP